MQAPSVYQPFLIANPRTGLERDITPFLLPNDAYPLLENCYLFRGRILKKGGTTLLGRLGFRTRWERTRAAAPDAFSFVLPPFERGSATVTDGVTTFQDNGGGVFAVVAGAGTAGTVDYVTFTVTGTFTAASATEIYSSWQAVTDNNSPTMGLEALEITSDQIDGLIGFDLLYAYAFSDLNNRFEQLWNYIGGLASATIVTWSGTDSDFFHSANWTGAFFATNHIPGFYPNTTNTVGGAGDGIRWWGTTASGTGWANFRPQIDATNYLLGARFILPYKGRLLCFNTWEGPNYAGRVNFANRIRWSQIGTPFYAVPIPTIAAGTDVNAWRSDAAFAGKGGFIGIDSDEQITSVERVRDDIIIFCERTRYRLIETGNKSNPFILQQIEDEFGCESPDSPVSLDRAALSVSFAGITVTDGVNTQRIDEKIPDESFNFHNGSNGHLRVHGVRDYYSELIYWTFTNDDGDPKFPNRTLVYNYIDQSWAIFKTQFTTFGYFHTLSDLTWATATSAWSNYNLSWSNADDQSRFPLAVGGNQHGYVVYIRNGADVSSTLNDYSLSITGISAANPAVITVPNHGLEIGQWVRITGVNGVTNLNTTTTGWQVYSTPTINTITLADTAGIPFVATGTYTYGGKIALLDGFRVETKRFPLFMEGGRQSRLGYTDLLVDAFPSDAEFDIQFFENEVYTLPIEEQIVSCVNASSPTPERIWTRIYLNSQGQFFALRMLMSDEQQADVANASTQFAVHALLLWAKASQRWIT